MRIRIDALIFCVERVGVREYNYVYMIMCMDSTYGWHMRWQMKDNYK